MKNFKISSIAAALFLTFASIGQASTIQNSSTGLSSTFTTETFSSDSPNGTEAGNNYSGITFGAGNYILTGFNVFPTMVDQVISNFYDTCCTIPTSISFAKPVSGAAFNFVSNPGMSTFTAFLNGAQVKSFTETTDYSGNFYGFENINFDSIQIEAGGDNNAYILDNLQVTYALDNPQAAAVPEPETYAMVLTALSVMGFIARRRKSL